MCVCVFLYVCEIGVHASVFCVHEKLRKINFVAVSLWR